MDFSKISGSAFKELNELKLANEEDIEPKTKPVINEIEKTYNLDFNKINEKARELGLTSKSIEQIIKQNRRRSVLPHPSVIEKIIKYAKNTKNSPKKHVKAKLVNTTLQIARFLSAEYSVHELTGDAAISNSYFKDIFTHFNPHRSVINLFMTETHRGNNMDDNGCSSFVLDDLYSENDIVYIKRDQAHKLVSNALQGKLPLRLYRKAYKKQSDKNRAKLANESGVIGNTEEINVIADLIITKPTVELTEEAIIESLDDIYMKKLSPEVIQNIKGLHSHNIEVIERANNGYIAKDHKFFNAIKSEKSLKALKKGLVNGKLYFTQSTSSVDRVYNVLNRIDKYTRNIIFSEYIELDITNAANNLIIKTVEEKIESIESTDTIGVQKALKEYKNATSKREKIINDILTEIKKEINVLNGRSRTVQEIKGRLKILLLTLLFGSNLNKDYIEYKVSDAYEKMIAGKVQDFNLQYNYQDNLRVIAKFLNTNLKGLSAVFMKRETKMMYAIMDVIGSREKIVHVHDAILLPRSIVESISIKQYNAILDIIKENGVMIKNITDIKPIAQDESINADLNTGASTNKTADGINANTNTNANDKTVINEMANESNNTNIDNIDNESTNMKPNQITENNLEDIPSFSNIYYRYYIRFQSGFNTTKKPRYLTGKTVPFY